MPTNTNDLECRLNGVRARTDHASHIGELAVPYTTTKYLDAKQATMIRAKTGPETNMTNSTGNNTLLPLVKADDQVDNIDLFRVTHDRPNPNIRPLIKDRGGNHTTGSINFFCLF